MKVLFWLLKKPFKMITQLFSNYFFKFNMLIQKKCLMICFLLDWWCWFADFDKEIINFNPSFNVEFVWFILVVCSVFLVVTYKKKNKRKKYIKSIILLPQTIKF